MSFLQHLGSTLKKILGIGVKVATVAEPIVDIAFPAVAPLYNSAIGLAAAAEGIAPGPGTGAQKLAQVLASIEPEIAAWAKQNNITWDQAAIEKWLSAVVDSLNLIPAPNAPTPPAA